MISSSCAIRWWRQVLEITEELMVKVRDVRARADVIRNYQKLFNVTQNRFEELGACMEEIELKHGLWESLKTWGQLMLRWAMMQFDHIDVADLEEKVWRTCHAFFKRFLI